MKVIHLEDNNFNDSIKDKVFLYFYADCCGPCKMLAPELEKVDSELSVVKVNVDEYEDIAREYGVMSIPTLIMFENGKPVKQTIGFMDKKKIESFIGK